jgi:dTDP-4-dehydrorhamnose 3,5-epimerase
MVEINSKDFTPKPIDLNNESLIEGCYLIPSKRYEDSRGLFWKFFPLDSKQELFGFSVHQVNLSHNTFAGTVRGLHYQIDPYLETKLISCIKGSVLDVLLDLRPDSKTYLNLALFSLNPNSGSLLVPPRVAHGFQTLEDNTSLLYIHSNQYSPEHSTGINAFDPKLNIPWPLPITVISESDRNLPLISEDIT